MTKQISDSEAVWLAPWRLEKEISDLNAESVLALARNLPPDYVVPGQLTTKLLRSEIFRGNFQVAERLLRHMVVTVTQTLELETPRLSEISFLILRRAMQLEAGKGKSVFSALCSRLVPRLTDAHGNFFAEISDWLLSEAVVDELASRLALAASQQAVIGNSFADSLFPAVKACEAEKFPGFLLARFHAVSPTKSFAFFESLVEKSEISRNFRSLDFAWETVRQLHMYRPREDADGRMQRRLLWTLEISASGNFFPCWTTLLAVDPSSVLGSLICRKFLPKISDHEFLTAALDFLLKKATLAEYLGGMEEISDHMNEALKKFPIPINLPLATLCIERRWWGTLQAVIGNFSVEISRVSEAKTLLGRLLTLEIPSLKIAIGNFFVHQLQPWLSEPESLEISDQISRSLSRDIIPADRSSAAAVKLLMIGNFIAHGNSPDTEICDKLLSRATADSQGLEILAKNAACLRFLASIATGENFQKVSDFAREKFPEHCLPDKMRTEISFDRMDVDVAKPLQTLDASEYLAAVQRDMEICQNFRSLWEPLVFSVHGRGLPSDAMLSGRSSKEISDLFDAIVCGEISVSRVYAVTVLLENLKKSLGSKRVNRVLLWLEAGNFYKNFQVMSRTLTALAAAARSQPHLRTCEKLLEISCELNAAKNFQDAYWCAYVALTSGRDRTGEQEPWWLGRSEKVLRNFRSFTAEVVSAGFLLRLVETVSGNLRGGVSIFLVGPLILDITMKFPCPQESELKPVLFTLFACLGNAGAKNLLAVCDARHRDILKALLDEFNFRHKFRGKV